MREENIRLLRGYSRLNTPTLIVFDACQYNYGWQWEDNNALYNLLSVRGVKLSQMSMLSKNQETIARQNEFAVVSPWNFNGILSDNLNRLKGKLYNLIESSISNEQQCNAVKGLIKDFCNSTYKTSYADMKFLMERLDLLNDSDDTPMTAEPLENL